MNYKLLDLYSDYLLSSFSATTATGLSRLMANQVSHDQVSRMLNSERLGPKDWWLMVKPHVRSMQCEDSVITIDDSIVEKPYTDEDEIICWHYDHAKGRTVKGINFITALYEVDDISLPVTFRLVTKTEPYIDKDGKPKRRSAVTKNEHYRAMLQQCVQNRFHFAMCSMTSGLRRLRTCALSNSTLKKSLSWRSKLIAKSLSRLKTNSTVTISGSTNLTCRNAHGQSSIWSRCRFHFICSARSSQTQTTRLVCAIW